MKTREWSQIVGLLLTVVVLCGCRSSLSVPLVDMSMDSRPNGTVDRERSEKLEKRIGDLERENRKLRDRLEKLERGVEKE